MRTIQLWLPIIALVPAACSVNSGFSPAVTPSAAPEARQAGARERVIYSFQSGADGADPLGTLAADSRGALYGTTAFGGGGGCFDGCGTVFKLTRSSGKYVEHVLYSFKGPSSMDGAGPGAGVIVDAGGALYGTTEYGGDYAGDGIVFKLTPSGSKYGETVLDRFKGGSDGTAPLASLTMDSKGNLYGATLLGGGATACGQNRSGGYVGCGTVFELKGSGSRYKERVLHSFQSGTDGATPGSPPIVVGRALYGTAATGGGNPACGGAPINPGCGTIYRLKPARRGYSFSVVYAFTGMPNDGANSFGGLVADDAGTLYGTTQYGGAQNQGAVFSLAPSGSTYRESLVHSFGGANDGSYPLAGLALGGHRLYGTTQYGGGSANAGVVFELSASLAERVLYRFESAGAGEYPVGGILVGGKHALYGTTSYGGAASAAAGTVFSLNVRR
ncbi:MAG: choice-of-anchor tandem repeat GloVer-containing protein [Candidatus Cybelea sp.]